MAEMKCHLKCALGTHNYIILPDKVTTIVGRSLETKISDKRCSKKQVALTADYQLRNVLVKNIGPNPGRVKGKLLKKDDECVLKDGDEFELLLGSFRHIIEFAGSKKRTADESLPNTKRLKSSTSTMDVEDSEEEKRVAKVSERLKILQQNSRVGLQHGRGSSDSDASEKPTRPSLMEWVKGTGSSKQSITKRNASVVNGCSSKDTDKIERPMKSITNSWQELNTLLIFTSVNVEPKKKVAAFDLDGTLICTKSGRVFPTNTDDWKIIFPTVKKKLKQIHDEGFKIVIFSNQKGLSMGKTKVSEFRPKVEAIIKELDVPAQAFISFKNDVYRKPAPGMWNYFIEKENGGLEVDIQQSIYVGDAAGRQAKWAVGKKKDFSCSDLLFSLNVKIPFQTPEVFFLGWNAPPFKMPDFDPRTVTPFSPICSPASCSIKSAELEVVVLVGFPAAGKSFFAKTHMLTKGYKLVNRDTLGSWQKCVSTCQLALSNGNSVVIDNTNVDKASRQRFIDCARESDVPCRCFYFVATIDHCRHNNKFRTLTDETHQTVSEMVLNSLKAKFEEPSVTEGFTEIVKINFVPKFPNPEMEKLYKTFLT